jgi:hypothetical protein
MAGQFGAQFEQMQAAANHVAESLFLNLFGESLAGDADHGPADHGFVVGG